MGIMCRNSSDRFKQQIVTKKFLSELSDMATNKKTEPRVLAMVIRVLSPLAFEFQVSFVSSFLFLNKYRITTDS